MLIGGVVSDWATATDALVGVWGRTCGAGCWTAGRGSNGVVVVTCVTQTRTFNYDLNNGRLMSVTKPETGTTTYTYNSDGTVQHVVDAKNQRTSFTYL